jgi:hypothetical protein
MEGVERLARSASPVPRRPPIRFDTDPGSLRANPLLLRKYGNDFASFLADNQDTTIGYNSEFRPVDQLRSVLGDHPLFWYFDRLATEGMDYKFTTAISEDERKDEVNHMLARGNHKSTSERPEVTQRLLKRDVTYGFAMACEPSIVKELKGAMVQPCGVAKQFSLQADGSRAKKERLTHDLSFDTQDRHFSVNNRIGMSQYPEMVYGWCLLRILHFVVALRLAHPTKKLFISKFDFSDAYKRVAHSARSIVQTIIVFREIAYIALRLTFGGIANPPAWCAISEMVTDLANEIALSPQYEPSKIPVPGFTTPTFNELPNSVPIAPARQMTVEIPTTLDPRHDCFIDDIVQIFLDTEANQKRMPGVVPLAVFATCRPHAGPDEPVIRRPLLSPKKLMAEGSPAEIQIVLGWELNTRVLRLLLPFDKFTAWTGDIIEIMSRRSVTAGNLASLVGRLNHTAYVIPLAGHFINRPRTRTDIHRPDLQQITLSKAELEDLLLWLELLRRANDGISLNRIVRRQPSRITFSDSCPYGMGGFLLSGRAWRLCIPMESCLYGQSTANNILEFLALTITV